MILTLKPGNLSVSGEIVAALYTTHCLPNKGRWQETVRKVFPVFAVYVIYSMMDLTNNVQVLSKIIGQYEDIAESVILKKDDKLLIVRVTRLTAHAVEEA